MLNQDRVLSKDQILDYVWEYDFGGNPGIVETYVGYLRKKLGDASGSRIETVRGFGYVLRNTSKRP
jgi:two-component system OmpR family response regulator